MSGKSGNPASQEIPTPAGANAGGDSAVRSYEQMMIEIEKIKRKRINKENEEEIKLIIWGLIKEDKAKRERIAEEINKEKEQILKRVRYNFKAYFYTEKNERIDTLLSNMEEYHLSADTRRMIERDVTEYMKEKLENFIQEFKNGVGSYAFQLIFKLISNRLIEISDKETKDKALNIWKENKIKEIRKKWAKETAGRLLEVVEVDPACTSADNDYIYPELTENKIKVYEGDGDGGYSSRYTKIFYDIIDVGIINNREAILFQTGIATYYGNSIRGVTKKMWLAGWDDGHLFLTQTYNTVSTVEEALDRLIPSEVKKAQKKGKKVLRQGDLWFIETNKKIPFENFKETEIRPGHKGLYYNGYATGIIKHEEHGDLDLGNKIWKVERNKTVSRSRVSYD